MRPPDASRRLVESCGKAHMPRVARAWVASERQLPWPAGGMAAKHLSRHVALEWVLSIAGMATVALVVAAMDGPARDYAHSVLMSGGGHIAMSQQAFHVATAAWDLCRDHESLAGFAGAATVLVLFMRHMR
jgi:hypothetical protein